MTYTFIEAMGLAVAGKKMRRIIWMHGVYIRSVGYQFERVNEKYKTCDYWRARVNDRAATDWQEYGA